jgi:cysteinyl-tRNA synthetase
MPDSLPPIRLYDSRSRAKGLLQPVVPGRIGLYVCGPTVYDRAHLGNARNIVVFDVLYRLLRHAFGAGNVTYVRNITDVDDKINARAAETGRTIGDITEETTRWFHEDMDALGALRPTHEPRATAFVPQMVTMIETLVARGHAYAAEGHVLFSVASDPSYGALSGRSTDDMIAGARVEVAPWKRDPMDFVLWKPSDDGLPGWDSPWGRGRPGWHIECSAMARDLLGGTFDIHGGGTDLTFPHHENELAQSTCAHPGEGFARVWMHNEMLQVEGRKMSKSLGNFLTVRDLLDRGVPGAVIRLGLLSTHYRKPMDWTEARVTEMARALAGWQDLAQGGGAAPEGVVGALADDLNVPGVVAEMHRLAGIAPGDSAAAAALGGGLALLGLADLPAPARPRADPAMRHRIDALLAERTEARAARDFDRADAIRQALDAAGVEVQDRTGAASIWTEKTGFDAAALGRFR